MLGVIGILFVILCLFYFFKVILEKYAYWKVKQVKNDPPIPFFGNHLSILLGQQTPSEKFTELYKKYNEEKYVGYYRGRVPELIIRDPELLKYVLIRDFKYFHTRGAGRDPKVEPLMNNVFSTGGDKWKLLRHELSPAFSISKIRSMFSLVTQCAGVLQSVAEASALEEKDIDACDLMARFSIDFIGAYGFGIEMNAIKTEKSLFLKLGHVIFNMSVWQIILLALRDLFPYTKWINNIRIANDDVRHYIYKILNIIREQRINETCRKRNDFIDLLLKIQSKGKISGTSIVEEDQNGLPKEVHIIFDEVYVAAQLFIFFAAGYESSSISTSFTLHQLAYHPDIQNEIQIEIDRVLKKHNGELCYDAISEMSLLEMAFNESLRIFPPAGHTTRICAKEYTIPGTKLTISRGTKVIIPIQGLHMDPKYYDNPTEFRPQRFCQAQIRKRNNCTFLPFGAGPRKCIGGHLGMYQSLAGLVAVLQRFTVEPTPTSRPQHRVQRSSYLLQACEGGLPIRLKLRKNREQTLNL